MSGLVEMLRLKMRMLKEDAAAVATVVEEAFQGRSELDDDQVGKDLRQVFYDLQDSKVLEVRRDESRGEAGTRRHYYWKLRDEPAFDAPELPPAPDPAEKLYHKLRDDAWERRRPADPGFDVQ